MAFAAGMAGAGVCLSGVCLGGLSGAALAKLLLPSRAPRRNYVRYYDDDYSSDDELEVSRKRRGKSDEGKKTKISPAELREVNAGFSTADAVDQADQNRQKALARTPSEVFADLQKGNTRFWMGRATRPEKSAFERRALISKQFPCVAVLGCSDSRVPVEIVFDMGLGDMFVIRVAGNCLDVATTASLQYAVNHLNVKVVIVMGHEGCGAVKAAGGPKSSFNEQPPALATLLSHLKNNLDDERLSCITDPRSHDREAVITNVRQQLFMLSRDRGIMEKVESQELMVVGAFYEISSGIVDFFFELTQAAPDDEGKIVKKGMMKGVQSRLNGASPTGSDGGVPEQRVGRALSLTEASESFQSLPLHQIPTLCRQPTPP